MQECQQQISRGNIEDLSANLKSIAMKLKKRNKLIKLADRSPAGWSIVQEYEHDPMASDSGDAQKIRQAERRAIRKKKVKSHRLPRFLKHPVFGFGTPVSKMDILHQSLQKQNLNTMETTRSTIYSTIPSTIPSDSPQRPKVQIPAWIAENKAT